MAFALSDNWVWDFWLADDGACYHLFYLHAPHALGDPELRHRNARIGHAASTDLITWTDHGEVIGPGGGNEFDSTATWTGSVVQGYDGVWRMFYTGSHFPSESSATNVECVGVAHSTDLFNWTKQSGMVLRADGRWYEKLGTSSWPEEAWRDPWVFRSEVTGAWHMLITARANQGPDENRGVIGHAISSDLLEWRVQPPLTAPNHGFAHLEVPQVVSVENNELLVFSCNAPRLCAERAGQIGGIWIAPAETALGPYDINAAYLLATEELYAGRLVQSRDGKWHLLAFKADKEGKQFVGSIVDPIPLEWNFDTQRLEAQNAQVKA